MELLHAIFFLHLKLRYQFQISVRGVYYDRYPFIFRSSLCNCAGYVLQTNSYSVSLDTTVLQALSIQPHIK